MTDSSWPSRWATCSTPRPQLTPPYHTPLSAYPTPPHTTVCLPHPTLHHCLLTPPHPTPLYPTPHHCLLTPHHPTPLSAYPTAYPTPHHCLLTPPHTTAYHTPLSAYPTPPHTTVCLPHTTPHCCMLTPTPHHHLLTSPHHCLLSPTLHHTTICLPHPTPHHCLLTPHHPTPLSAYLTPLLTPPHCTPHHIAASVKEIPVNKNSTVLDRHTDLFADVGHHELQVGRVDVVTHLEKDPPQCPCKDHVVSQKTLETQGSCWRQNVLVETERSWWDRTQNAAMET